MHVAAALAHQGDVGASGDRLPRRGKPVSRLHGVGLRRGSTPRVVFQGRRERHRTTPNAERALSRIFRALPSVPYPNTRSGA